MTGMEAVDRKIQKAEAKALRLKACYEDTLKELKALHDRRRELQMEKLMELIDKSGKTMDEVIRLIKL